MNKQEILTFLSEKKRITAPVAAAEDKANKAEQKYQKALKKWKPGISALLVLLAIWLIGLFIGGDTNLFYIDHNGSPQVGGIGGTLLFGGLLALVLYMKQTRYVKPAELEREEAFKNLQQAKSNPDYKNGAKEFPQKFYNYYDIHSLWNIINEGSAETLKEAYHLLETHHFQQNQIAIQEDIRRLQHEIATTSKANVAASAITAYNTAKTAQRLKK